MSLPEKFLQAAVKNDPPEVLGRRLERNFNALDKRLPLFSEYAETLLDDATAAAARATLGIGNFGTRFGTNTLTASASTAMSADTAYYHSVVIQGDPTLTGIQFFSLATTGTCRVALYDSAGTRVANRTTNSGTLSISLMQVAFSATYAASPGLYYASVVFSGTPNMNAGVAVLAGSTAGPGSGATATSITPPTTAASVPLLSTY